MKKFLFLLMFASRALFAQEDMSTVWQVKLDHKSDNSDIDFKKGLMLASDDSRVSIVKADDGKILWSKKFKEITPDLRKVDDQIAMWDANVLFCFDRKIGKDKIACIDINSGTVLWSTDKYQDLTDENIIYIPEMEAFAVSTKAALTMIKARTGEELWTTQKFKGVVGAYQYSGSDGSLVMLNYKPNGLASLFSGFKNQIMKVNMKNGDVMWDQTYVGMVERKVITHTPTAHIDIQNGKVFLYLNGLQVYDYNTGAQLWNAAFDFTVDVVSPPSGAKRFGVYGAVADPLIAGNDVYVLDFKTPRKQYIKKYDLNSGKLLWTSPEIPDAKAIPGMYLVDNTVVIQMGGQVECQAYIVQKTAAPGGGYEIEYIWKKYYRVAKPLGVMAYDATNGKQLWESERFRKDITNAFIADRNLIIASGKALYSLDIKSGKDNYEIQLGDDKIGLAQKIVDYKDKVIVIGEKGVASHAKSDGKLASSGKYKTADYAGMYGNMLIMETEKNDIAVFDVESCKFKQYDARKGASSRLSDDGQNVYVWDKKELLKLSTH
jgi:outer membrane protein assembly factor BamB